jgi:ferredoxin
MNRHIFDETMKNHIVFYFSGTGNSFYIAKNIANQINAKLMHINDIKSLKIVEADVVCFVFPSYDFNAPTIVNKIIEEASVIRANYVVAVVTYGVVLSKALLKFKKTLKKRKIELNSGFGIKMPHNAIGSIHYSQAENQKRIEEANIKIEYIVEMIKTRKKDRIEKTTFFKQLTILKHLPQIIKLVGILIFKGVKALEFTVTNDCIQCSICEQICPTKNITINQGKPEFLKDCTSCFACLQWCPKTAIQIGKYSFSDLGMKKYRHPFTKADDLIKQVNHNKQNK